MTYLTTLLVSIVITIVIMPYSKALAVKLQAMDKPNHRKIHKGIMPKCGGIAMAVGASVPIMLWAPKTNFMNALLLGALIIVIFGVADDMKDLAPNLKLLGQVMAAVVVTLVGGVQIADLGNLVAEGIRMPVWVAIPLTIFVIVGVTNATNLSDGLDGLAGGMSLMILLCIGYLGLSQNDWVTTMIAIAVGGSVLGFLRFNSYPAQLFMGDAGSQLLGFVAAVLLIKLSQQSSDISVTLPLVILGVPVLDTLTVMFKRMIHGRSPFSADRNHFHHQLMKIGLFHTESVLTIYLGQAVLILFAILYRSVNDWLIISFYIVFSISVLLIFHLFNKTEYCIKRDGFINSIKLQLSPLKDRGQVIKYSFGIVKIGVPTLLMFNIIYQLPGNANYFILSIIILIFLLVAWSTNNDVLNKISKIALYLFTPFIILNCDQELTASISIFLNMVYNLFYFILLLAVFVTMKFTRRANGFKSSTLDFLVIFIIILIPNLPAENIKGHLLGLVAVKTVIIYYSYEVLVGELRKRPSVMCSISIALVLVIAKGLFTILK